MRVVITGRSGQLGRQIDAACVAAGATVVDLPRIDLQDPSITDSIAAARPGVIIHAAAMTNVDGCARDPDLAFAINGLGTQRVALAARRTGAYLLYVSTNEVFSGTTTRPYVEDDPIAPANPYGRSKAAGEGFVQALVAEWAVVRTAWVFGPGGNNFVTKMTALAEKGPLRMVADETSAPSYAPDLATAIVRLAQHRSTGIFHLTNSPECTRFEYAQAIFDLSGIPVEMTPISIHDFDRPSRVPQYAPLANTRAAAVGVTMRPWRDALAEYLAGPR